MAFFDDSHLDVLVSAKKNSVTVWIQPLADKLTTFSQNDAK